MRNKEHIAMNIVNQLFDLAEVSVEKRQEINDKADVFVNEMLDRYRVILKKPMAEHDVAQYYKDEE